MALLLGVTATYQLRAPYYAARVRVDWNITWTQNLLQSTLTPQFPNNQDDWPLPKAYQPLLQTWSYSYNLNLIGKDKLPVGDTVTDLPPRAYEYHVQFRTWTLNLQTSTLQPIPYGKPVYERPPLGPQQPDRNFGASYNPNLVGKDFVPGDQYYDRPPLGPIQPDRGYTFTYLKTLTGQDSMIVGEQVTNLPPQLPTLLQTWINTISLALTAQGNPFRQTDWPLPIGPQQPERTIMESFNLNLIGQDQLPFNQKDWPLPTQPYRQPQLLTWIDQVKLLLLVPIKQTDWPVPKGPQPLLQTWQSPINLNLLGKDFITAGEQVTDLPPRDYDRSIQLRTWTQSYNLPLNVAAATLPFNQYDWPNPKAPLQPTQIQTATFPKTLIGQDVLPFNQKDWPLPGQPYRPNELRTWIDRSKSYLQPPHRQRDWPLPILRTQPALTHTFSFPLTLIGKDKLPFNQYNWPNPRGHEYPIQLRSTITTRQLTPVVVVTKPFNQYDWPNPRGTWDGMDRTFTARNSNLQPFVPPPTPELPNIEIAPVRDWWDRDEWGNFYPGAGIRK